MDRFIPREILNPITSVYLFGFTDGPSLMNDMSFVQPTGPYEFYYWQMVGLQDHGDIPA